MYGNLQIKKILNNNVIIADHPTYQEVVIIGKGIGFNRKSKEVMSLDAVEKMFILKNEKEKQQYEQLVLQIDEKLIEVMNEVIHYIMKQSQKPLNEHIHIALTDHIAFAIKRLCKQVEVYNPFLLETRELYQDEYKLAEHVIQTINEKMQVQLPEAEIGFIALHIHSAMTNRDLASINEHSRLITNIIGLIEKQMKIKLDKSCIAYSRLIRHLRFAIERVHKGEQIAEVVKIAELLKQEYPEMYSLAWTIIKFMQKQLNVPVYDAEATYLTIHLERLHSKNGED